MRVLIATALCAVSIVGCNRAPQEPRVTVDGAYVTLPAVEGRPGAAYFRLRTNVSPTTILGVMSPLVQRIELHESMTKDGKSNMASIEDTTFPGNRVLEFEPGGKHAMLFGIHDSVKVGSKIPLTFNFDPAPAVTVEAEVRAPGDVHASH